MPNTGAINPGTITAPGWTNPNNAKVSDNAYAVITIGDSSSATISATNFGFSVPTTSTILGVVVTFECKETTFAAAQNDQSVRLIKGGSASGSDKGGTHFLALTDTVFTYGASTDLWGNTLTPADVNASNFGVTVTINSSPADDCNVDAFTMTIYYDGGSIKRMLPILGVGK